MPFHAKFAVMYIGIILLDVVLWWPETEARLPAAVWKSSSRERRKSSLPETWLGRVYRFEFFIKSSSLFFRLSLFIHKEKFARLRCCRE